MKKVLLLVIIMVYSSSVKADHIVYDSLYCDYKGVLCYVSVNLSTDPTENGYLKYTIPLPKPWGGFDTFSVEGPGQPQLYFLTSTTAELWLRKNMLLLDVIGMGYAQENVDLWHVN